MPLYPPTASSSGDSYTVNADETKNSWCSYPLDMNRSASATFNGWTSSGLNSGTDGGGYVSAITVAGSAYALTETGGNGSGNAFRTNQSKGLRLKMRIKFGGTGIEAYGIVDATAVSYADQTSTAVQIRIVNNAGTLYASHGNGTNNVNTNINTGITDTDWHIYEFVFTPGVDIKFYIDGTLVATHTTNLPNSGNGMEVGFGLSANGSAISLNTPVISIQQ